MKPGFSTNLILLWIPYFEEYEHVFRFSTRPYMPPVVTFPSDNLFLSCLKLHIGNLWAQTGIYLCFKQHWVDSAHVKWFIILHIKQNTAIAAAYFGLICWKCSISMLEIVVSYVISEHVVEWLCVVVQQWSVCVCVCVNTGGRPGQTWSCHIWSSSRVKQLSGPSWDCRS